MANERVGNPAGMKHLTAVMPYLRNAGFIVNLVPSGIVGVHPNGTTITASNKRTKLEVRRDDPEGFEVARCNLPPTLEWIQAVLLRFHP